MYRSLQYVTFMSCNVVVLHRIILYCNVGRRVKDGVVHRSHQQLLVAKWLRLGMRLFLFFFFSLFKVTKTFVLLS